MPFGFIDGLMDKVNIYKLNRTFSNRTSKNKMANSEVPDMKNVPCRIIKNEKILFEKEIDLVNGDVIEEINTGEKFTITDDGYIVRGMNTFHHTKYTIEKKRI
ncbi:hypothetical protein [Anaerophilus nitritogenes]|uniref:hypothetical protein n=1 Tax=Anaerophilus nitritogenes TaxID=2498136 RepID=UPI00101E08B4|nr:hypothetical protein [Anaerophilus nitritogenes]